MNEQTLDVKSEEEKDVFDLIYKLEDNPPVKEAMFAALQHLLAIIVGIITPTLIIGGVLGLGSEMPYLISMSLIVSGVATFIQVKRIGPVGSGLLSIQGTSFAFLGAILTAGFMVKSQGGVLGDGVNSAIAAAFNTFPNTTFSQNNGVIQLTGIASRYVGMYLAGFLVVLGLFPVIGAFFRSLPNPVLGGATIVMFGTVGAAGIRIIASSEIDRRDMLIMAVAFGLGFGVAYVPEFLSKAPKAIQQIFGSALTTGGIAALLLNAFLPGRSPDKPELNNDD